MNQIAVKVFPALATGCTMVLKPSRSGAVLGPDLRRNHGRGTRARRRVQLDPGRWPGCRGGARPPSGRRLDLLHRIDARRCRHREERRRHRQARVPGAGRQEPEHHSRRRRLREARGGRSCVHDGQFRPDLQCALAHARAQGAHGRSHPHCAGGCGQGDGRRPQRQFRDRSGGVESPVREDPGVDQERHRRGCDPRCRRPRDDRKGSTRVIT